ncbi:MAG: hypothetical protein ACI4EA_10620 [Candidatus Ornithomonoglobus sp.]
MRKYEEPSIMISVFNEAVEAAASEPEVKGTNLVDSAEIYTITRDSLQFTF